MGISCQTSPSMVPVVPSISEAVSVVLRRKPVKYSSSGVESEEAL